MSSGGSRQVAGVRGGGEMTYKCGTCGNKDLLVVARYDGGWNVSCGNAHFIVPIPGMVIEAKEESMDHELVIGRIVHCVNRDAKGQRCNPAMVVEVPDPSRPIRVRVFTTTNAGYSVSPYHSHIDLHQHTWHWPDECDEYRRPAIRKGMISSDEGMSVMLNPGTYIVTVSRLGEVTAVPRPEGSW